MADGEGGGEAELDVVEFLGEFRHSLDAKGRLILPADFREQLTGGGFVTKILDGCLAVVTPREFRRRSAEMLELARGGLVERQTVRAFAAASKPVAPDGQGRIVIPQALREYAALERDVVVVGVINKIELWNPERWAAADAAGSNNLMSGQDALAGMGF